MAKKTKQQSSKIYALENFVEAYTDYLGLIGFQSIDLKAMRKIQRVELRLASILSLAQDIIEDPEEQEDVFLVTLKALVDADRKLTAALNEYPRHVKSAETIEKATNVMKRLLELSKKLLEHN